MYKSCREVLLIIPSSHWRSTFLACKDPLGHLRSEAAKNWRESYSCSTVYGGSLLTQRFDARILTHSSFKLSRASENCVVSECTIAQSHLAYSRLRWESQSVSPKFLHFLALDSPSHNLTKSRWRSNNG